MRRSAYRGCLLGLAVGDAMGYTVDSRSWREIQEDYGPNGLLGYDLVSLRKDASIPPITTGTSGQSFFKIWV